LVQKVATALDRLSDVSDSTVSAGSWLTPPGVRRKIIAEGTLAAMIIASWPAPLTMRYGSHPA